MNPLENESGIGTGNITGQIVLIEGFKYEPQDLTIPVGETVNWINKDSVGHTVTSDEGEELNSNLLAQDEIYEHTFNQAGEYPYYCVPHPFMTGKIIVE
jgi:amicyanin